jgi:hypothetical protein
MTKVTVERNKAAKQKNIFNAGNLVEYIAPDDESEGYIVLVVDHRGDTDRHFSGVQLTADIYDAAGSFLTGFCKESFRKFEGTVTLESQ